jgi:hypothetical protein
VSAGNTKQVEQVQKKIEAVKKLNAVLNNTPKLNNAQKKNALNRVVAGESVNAVKNSLNLPKKKPGFFAVSSGVKINNRRPRLLRLPRLVKTRRLSSEVRLRLSRN